MSATRFKHLAAAAAAAGLLVELAGCQFHKPQCRLMSRPFAIVSPEVNWSIDWKERAGVMRECTADLSSHIHLQPPASSSAALMPTK